MSVQKIPEDLYWRSVYYFRDYPRMKKEIERLENSAYPVICYDTPHNKDPSDRVAQLAVKIADLRKDLEAIEQSLCVLHEADRKTIFDWLCYGISPRFMSRSTASRYRGKVITRFCYLMFWI